jgi:hypothetical protein
MPHGLTPNGRAMLTPRRRYLNTATIDQENGDERRTTLLHIAEHAVTCRTFRGSLANDTASDMETQQRRSRMRRTRAGKRIELTSRDIEIFKLLRQYRYLRSTYIHAFVGGASETRFKERLGDLFHEGYIDRPERQWEMSNCRHRPVIHELGSGGTRILGEQEVVEECRTWLGAAAHRQFLHSLMICEVLASLDLAMRADPRLRFIAWPEMLTRAPQAARTSMTPFQLPLPAGGYVVPDGLFGIEYAKGGTKAYRFFALEADRGTMPVARSNPNQTSYLGKLAAYREIIARQLPKTRLGIPNLLVLTVTMGEARMADINSRLESETASSAAFLFKTFRSDDACAPMVRLLSEPWLRAGLPPLRIDE